MKIITLTQGQSTMVDDEDFVKFSKFKWWAQWNNDTGTYYAVRSIWVNGSRKHVSLAREIAGNPRGFVDHMDRDTLNNRRGNLRPATRSQNRANSRLNRNSSSRKRGVYSVKSKWRAQIRVGGKLIHLGYFANKDAAANKYAEARRRYFGNFIGGI